MSNIAVHLSHMARDRPQASAVVEHASQRKWTFSELEAESNRLANGLNAVGAERGMRVLVMIQPGLEFTAVVFALLKVGALPVMIDPGMGIARMLGCIRQARPEGFIGVPLAQVFRVLHSKAFTALRTVVTVGRRWGWRGHVLSDLRSRFSSRFELAEFAPRSPAAILFTSGSTGPPKGVLYEHGMFQAQVSSIRDHFGIAPGEIELATFALFALFCPALGMTCVFPEMDFSRPGGVNPARFVEAANANRATSSFGSPAVWERVSRWCRGRGLVLSSLRRVLIAGAPVSWRLVERVRSCLPPNADVHTPYGATEALPVSSITGAEILEGCSSLTRNGSGICVGAPLPDREVRIVRITDAPITSWRADDVLPEGEIGEIVVSGAVVTREYFGRSDATAVAKIEEHGKLWHRMGDAGYLDDRGRLWYCGRKSHRLRTVQGPMFTECCEGIFTAHADVARAALVGIGPNGEQEPVIIIEPRPGRFPRGSRRRELTEELLRLAREHPPAAGVGRVLYHRRFPVDVRHNAKIDRDALRTWAERQP